MRLDEARMAPVAEAEMTPEQEALAAPARERYGMVFNVLKTLMRNMPLLEAWNNLAGHIMASSSLPPRWREILIMRVGWLTQSEYEWGQHVLMSARAGLTVDDHARIRVGSKAEGWSTIERSLLAATDELLDDTMISDATWKALIAELTEEQILDLIFTIGQYNMLAMALNALGVQREPGVPGFAE
ncbi:MAG: carboxymuconolactone decarboxylase family protein [Gammaproteobacteria bacterium]|nr:carboxymuconolactone decarboxylase family protein [Gammaproteobacteria bacterium]